MKKKPRTMDIYVPPIEDLDLDALKKRIERFNATALGQRLLREGWHVFLERVTPTLTLSVTQRSGPRDGCHGSGGSR